MRELTINSIFNKALYYKKDGRVFIAVAFLLLVLVIAIFFGLLAVTTNPVFISFGVALLVAPLILARPDWNIWIILVSGLLMVGVLPLLVDWLASKAVWGVSLLGFMLILSALFRAVSVPESIRSSPFFVWLALAFMLFTILSSLAQWSSFYEFSSGFKRYYQAIGLLFALSWFDFTEQKVRLWKAFFIIVTIAQLPWAIYQLMELVPMRENLRIRGLVPIDVVSGTFGAHMFSGGASGEMATFLVIVLAFLMAHRREKLLGLRKYLLLLPPVLAPLFMGETKVVIILLPLMFLILFRNELVKRPLYALFMLAIASALTVGAGYVYLNSLKEQDLDTLVASTLSYNVGEQGYGGYVLNRTTALTFWAEKQGMHDPVSAVFGNGLGSAQDSSGGSLAQRYHGYGISLTAASSLLWEQGSFGTLLFLSMLACAWRTAGKLQREVTQPWIRADAAAIQAVLPLFAFYLFYRLALLENLPFQIVFYSLLGYLAWLYRRNIIDTSACA